MYQEAEFQKAFVTLWAAMLEYGTVIANENNLHENSIAHHGWNQYTGAFEGQKPSDIITPGEGLGERINWDKTTLPFYQTMGEFTSTGDPYENIECMLGKLKMKTGEVFWVATSRITDVMRVCKTTLDSRTVHEQEPDLVAKWGL